MPKMLDMGAGYSVPNQAATRPTDPGAGWAPTLDAVYPGAGWQWGHQ
ncbi:MAG: hypothetical protein ACRDNL_05795 [Spirillospora sp.]